MAGRMVMRIQAPVNATGRLLLALALPAAKSFIRNHRSRP